MIKGAEGMFGFPLHVKVDVDAVLWSVKYAVALRLKKSIDLNLKILYS